MADVVELQESIFNLSISSGDRSPGEISQPDSLWMRSRRVPFEPSWRSDGDNPRLGDGAWPSPPAGQAGASHETPNSQDSTIDHFSLPHSSPPAALGRKHSNYADSRSVSSGPYSTPGVTSKYIPPRLRQPPAQVSCSPLDPRQTPPVSPQPAFMTPRALTSPGPSLRSPGLPPTGPKDPRFQERFVTPRKESDIGGAWRSSPSKTSLGGMKPAEASEPSTPASIASFASSTRSALTPLSENKFYPSTGRDNCALSSSKSSPMTPDSSFSQDSNGLSKTAVKRIIHDSRAQGLTFNQKKHRSPSHLRRSIRRQQERACKDLSTPSVDKENAPDGYCDPWEDTYDEKPQMGMSQDNPAQRVLVDVTGARQNLSYEERAAKLKSFR